ncbi:outer membrane autotransporter protein [Buttiauxella sp. BIGb0471]|uniref:autotransporter outer membrane beta-barrel domain-containing protein n=1 Tax=Buttiauxella sp. BIGb0471 TaxID=2940597 RepID=UPI0021676EA2|nr:autotransporter outer membrane beta-barrel domain-containing protein [Buttiauxella sp. BIGb0471]MCS3601971.1 outer membrane autotransporter protein [Buttiauxella sp. BIGb0471]
MAENYFNARRSLKMASLGVMLLALETETTYAACDNFTPASGEQTTCSPDPIPVTQPITAQTNSSQVSVIIDPNATVTIANNNGVLIYTDSTAQNLGTINIAGDTFDAISSRGDGNQQINAGTIFTTGIQSEGLFSEGNGNQLTNSATGLINTSGANASGMANISNNAASNNVLLNEGTIVTLGDGADGIYAQSGGNTLINNGGITTSGTGAHGLEGNGANNVITNNSVITTNATGANGINNVGAPTVGNATNNGTISTVATNANGVYFGSPGTFTNASTGTINAAGAYGAYLSAGGIINNAGSITAGRSAITNDVGPTTVNNSGSLTSGSGDYGIWFFNSPGDVLNNSGNITGGNGVAVQYSAGNDQFIWHDSGVIQGSVLMDAGDDSAFMSNLTSAQLSDNMVLDGGADNDSLQLDNSAARNPARLVNFETLNITNSSALTLDSPLVLGDSVTGTGVLNIDASSQLLAGEQSNAQIQSSITGNRVTVNNAGEIDLTNGGTSTSDNLTINGNYVGQNGIIRLQTVLGDDSSPSDKVTISDGEASGNTQLQVVNVSGPGAAILANGILLIDTVNGATTTANAFTLSGGQVSAGAYEYRLFRGGITAGSENKWFLRNSLIVTPPTDPEPPVDPETPVDPQTPVDPGTPVTPVTPEIPVTPPTEPNPSPTPGEIIPLYREEVPLYSALTPLAFNIGLTQIATFHERQGEQSFLSHSGTSNGSWGRILGSHTDQHWRGDISPSFDGNVGGVQLGQDFYASATDHAGLFFGYTRVVGDVRGFVEGEQNRRAGSTTLNGYSLGAYWTHIWQNQAYLDAVLMNTWLSGSQESERNMNADINGNLRSASLESGYPLPLSGNVTLEPQVQFIVQNLSIDNSHDAVSTIRYDDETTYTGRIGLRLQGHYGSDVQKIQPWINVNYWQGANHTAQLYLGEDGVNTATGSKAVQVGAGISATINPATALYVAVNQTSDLDSEHRRDYSGNFGVRVTW